MNTIDLENVVEKVGTKGSVGSVKGIDFEQTPVEDIGDATTSHQAVALEQLQNYMKSDPYTLSEAKSLPFVSNRLIYVKHKRPQEIEGFFVMLQFSAQIVDQDIENLIYLIPTSSNNVYRYLYNINLCGLTSLKITSQQRDALASCLRLEGQILYIGDLRKHQTYVNQVLKTFKYEDD